MAFANFHMHTVFSDGASEPEELVRAVYDERDLEFFAVTDHDTLSGIEPVFRCMRRYERVHGRRGKTFVPGVELSAEDPVTGRPVHLIGLFPHITGEHYREGLARIETVLGPHCRSRTDRRGVRDLDARVRCAHELNLDGLADRFHSPEEVIRLLRSRADALARGCFERAGKAGDVVRCPIPVTYQVLVDHWQELVPTSTREKIGLYTLRPDDEKRTRLMRIYLSEGMSERDAEARAAVTQGILATCAKPPSRDVTPVEGLMLLRKAGAVTFLAHPAVDHEIVEYDTFDQAVLLPLLNAGLDGIEVWYPYGAEIRDEAVARYEHIARSRGVLMSGGTDYHGDGRSGMSDVRLEEPEAVRIMGYRAG